MHLPFYEGILNLIVCIPAVQAATLPLGVGLVWDTGVGNRWETGGKAESSGKSTLFPPLETQNGFQRLINLYGAMPTPLSKCVCSSYIC